MKIGFLHSFRTHLGNIANAKEYRIHYKDWKANPEYWMEAFFYGENTDRKELRGLIYSFRSYYREFQDIYEYDLIALSLNFDAYPKPLHFYNFVMNIIADLYRGFPILHHKEVIIMAGNEVYEKRKSVEKVVQTTWDTAQGIKNSIKPDLPICCWNEKIYTSGEKKAFNDLLNNSTIKSICKYVGYQSLGTRACDLATYIRYAINLGYEPIDVELGHFSEKFGVVKELFDINKDNQIKKVFILTPYISDKMTDENFKKYALSIGDFKKDKFKLVQYIQQFRDDEQKEVMNKMFDDILLGICYIKGTRGWGVKRLQIVFNKFIAKCQEDPEKWVQDVEIEVPNKILEDGLFGSQTKKAIEFYQMMFELDIDGKAGRETLTSMFNFMLKRYDKTSQALITHTEL